MTDPNDKQKSALRVDITNRLRAMSSEERHEKSISVCRRVCGLESFRHATTIMLYMPLPSEVDITPIAIRSFQLGTTVCVPRVDWKRKEMTAVEVRRFDDDTMDVDEHGIRVPRDGRIVIPGLIDLIIVPGLAFDTHGKRLGRGGGYYDRFLGKVSRQAAKIAVAYDEQIVEEVPVNERDMRVDLVVTDRRATRTNRPSPR